MNVIAAALLLLALAQSDTSALVEASKAGKAKRKGSTTKVITNADVAKANKSKVVERKGGSTAPVKPSQTLTEKYEAERKTRIAREEQLALLGATIAQLEKELAAIEQAYYEENDLNLRDTQIVKRFDETKAKLDDARKKRDELLPKAE